MMTSTEIRQDILKNGCYSSEENLRIYEKWFTQPRRAFLAAFKTFSLEHKRVCDVGCGYGNNLTFCSDDSYGIEMEAYYTKFARSIGLTVYHKNIFDDLGDFPKVDVVAIKIDNKANNPNDIVPIPMIQVCTCF